MIRIYVRTVLRRVCPLVLALWCGSPLVMADDEPLNYEQHVRPILRAHCFTCHNQEQSKGGLAVDSFGDLMTGGAGGEVVYPRDLDGSRLWQLVSHQDEPYMPPNAPQLAESDLETIRKWIEQGTVDKPGGKAAAETQVAATFTATTHPDGPGAIPVLGIRQPVRYTDRAAGIRAIACSPNAPLVAIGGERQAALYHTESGQLLSILPFPAGQVSVLTFSRDGSLIVVGGGRAASRGLVALYDVTTSARLAELGDELDSVLAADIDPSLQRVALGGPGRVVRLYDTATSSLVAEMKRHTDWIMATAFSPDGKLLATADRQGGLWLWEADSGLEVQDLPGHGQAITGISWRADSQVLASCSEDGNVRLWSIDEGKQIRNWAAHPGGALVIRFGSDGTLVTGGRDRVVKLWDGAGKLLHSYPAMADIVLQAAVTHDSSRTVGGDWTGQVKVWNKEDAAELHALAANPPTLEMRVQKAVAALAAAGATPAKTRQQLGEVVKQLDERQKTLEQLAGKLLEDWRGAISGLMNDQPAERPAPDFAAQEEKLAQLTAEQKTAYEKASQLRAALDTQAAKLEEATAQLRAAEAELKRFGGWPQQLEQRVKEAEQLTQAAERTYEQIEREKLALAKLVKSASGVANQPGLVGDVAMEEADGAAPATPAKQWALDVQKRAAAELAACQQRLDEADQKRQQAARDLQIAADQVPFFKSAYGMED